MATKKVPKSRNRPHRSNVVYIGGDPAEKPVIYVNNVEAQTSVMDVQLRLNRVASIDRDTDTIGLVCQATLVMSPQNAKSLAILLASIVEKYEDDFGELPRRRDEPIDDEDA